MKILNLAPLIIIVHLANNVKCAWNLIIFTIANCFHLIRRNFEYITPFEKYNMERNQPQEEEEDQHDDHDEDLDGEEEQQDEPMELDISDIETDDELFADNSSDDDHQLGDEEIFPETRNPSSLGVSYSVTRTVCAPKPIYTFKPMHLIEINYKKQNHFNKYPSARSGHRVIASDGNLYSLGGYNPRRAIAASRMGRCLLFQELWCFNFASNSWDLVLNSLKDDNMPKELASNALAIHNNVLISHGGTGYPFGDSCSNDCYVYTIGETHTVKRLKVTGDLPTPLYGPGIVIHENYLYTIGGTTGFEYSCDVYRLNLKTNVWENVYICRPEMRDDPEGRYRHEVVYDGKHIYVLGGGTSHLVYDLQRIAAFNLSNNTWDYFDTLPDRTLLAVSGSEQMQLQQRQQPQICGYPKPRKCLSCVQHTLSNGDIEAFITGGLQGDYATYFADIWKLNLRTKQWTLIQTAMLPKPLYFHSAAHSNNGCMYIFGGIEYDIEEMRRRNSLYKMWMTIPKLSEMCWEAITYYNRSLNHCKKAKLLGVGIPQRFIDRL